MNLASDMAHPKNYWKNKENVIEESRKYTNRTAFKKGSHAAYDSARRLGLIDGMYWLDNGNEKPKGFWKVKENVFNEARKYKDKDEFKMANPSAFLAAYRYGYIDDMDWLVRQRQHKKGYWTYDTIEEEAVKYETKGDFRKNCSTAYRKALELGIIEDFFTNDYIEY